MSMALAEETKHHHTFKVKYKLVDDEMVIQPVCQCTGCDTRAHIKYDGRRIMVTFVVGREASVSYTATLWEGN